MSFGMLFVTGKNTHDPQRERSLMKLHVLPLTILTILSASISHADDDISALWLKGKPTVDARLRYEFANNDGTLKPADAVTLRVRPGFQTGVWAGFSGLIEGEYTTEIVDNYNSTRNNNTKHLAVVDPETMELNQLLVKYAPNAQFDATVGRQRINLDNQRFVGGVAFRQNEQTYDGISLNFKPYKELGFYYAYINQVNTIFGSESVKPKTNALAQPENVDTSIHLAQVKYAHSPALNAVLYTYLMDIEAWGAVKHAQSNATYGLRLTGKQDAVRYVAEYAKQKDHADQPLNYSADYYNLELGYSLPASLAKGEVALGYEVLGSYDNKKGFQTPLATKHKFNGWTDMFLNTPNAGLKDLYLSSSVSMGDKCKLGLEVHSYDSDEKGSHYGDEYGVSFWHQLPVKGLSASTKYSMYKADEVNVFTKAAGNRDTDKVWLQVDYKY
jgi:hypothetical protein